MFHNECGHQEVEQTVVFMCGRFYWGTLLQNTQHWVKNCQHCKTAMALNTDPESLQVSLVVNYPMKLLCLDFMKVDPRESGKENNVGMLNAFFSSKLV